MLNEHPSATNTTITISGSVPDDSVVTKFMVQWHRDTSVGCSDEDEDSVTEDGDFTSYEITRLKPHSKYIITVTTYNAAGSGPVSDQVMVMTLEAGKKEFCFSC